MEEERQEQEEQIDYKAVYEQVIAENEGLREKLAQVTLTKPIGDAIEGIVLVVQKSDPMKLYLWACIGLMIALAVARILEVFIR